MNIQFSENSSEDEYLKSAVKISNRYLLNYRVQSNLKENFVVSEDTIKKMEKIQIVYAKQIKLKEEEPDNLGWTDRILDTYTIYVNEIFQKRLDKLSTRSKKRTTKHRKEKEIVIIVVFISILIVHELCHLLVRWNGQIDSPQSMGEAGEFIEMTIFNGSVRLLVHSKSKWNENKAHIGIAIERFATGLNILSYQDYIMKVHDESMPINDYNKAVFIIKGLDSNTVAKKVSDEENNECELENAVTIESCGVRRCAFIKKQRNE